MSTTPGRTPEVGANSRTIPGIITQRGCAYAGCKGVVLGPTRDIVQITHGPIGCGYYSWLTRRNQTRPNELGPENYMPYAFSTDMQEQEIIFGGEKKLKAAVEEAYQIFKPRAIAICSTCPVGLIGDDVHAVAREMKEKLGINVFGFSCEGYKGVSQSAGHHIANNQFFKHVVGQSDRPVEGRFKINLLGEYNIGGDSFVIEDLFAHCGFTLVATFSGNACYEDMANSQQADLNLVMCHRSINYMAQMMETKYGIPWFKVNFIGAESTAKSLRKMGQYFGDPELAERVEAVIAEEEARIAAVRAEVRGALRGQAGDAVRRRLAGPPLPGPVRRHRHEDGLGRLRVRPPRRLRGPPGAADDQGRCRQPQHRGTRGRGGPRGLPPPQDRGREGGAGGGRPAARCLRGHDAADGPGALVIDDINHHESEKLIAKYRPAVFCAGIKEKFAVQKMGVPCKQLHNYDIGGPYAGFAGAANFYREIDRLVNTRIWKLIQPPWEAEEA